MELPYLTYDLIKSQEDAVKYFFSQMDIEMLGDILDENITYQKFPKDYFLEKLQTAFNQFEKAGDKYLTMHYGLCRKCSEGCRGVTFLGKNGHYIDVLFLAEGGIIKDIYECTSFNNYDKQLNKITRIEIDPVSDLFPDQ